MPKFMMLVGGKLWTWKRLSGESHKESCLWKQTRRCIARKKRKLKCIRVSFIQADYLLVIFSRGNNCAVCFWAFSAATYCSVTLFAPNIIISLSFLKNGLARLHLFSFWQSQEKKQMAQQDLLQGAAYYLYVKWQD